MWKSNSKVKKFQPCLIRGASCRAHTNIVGMLRLCLLMLNYMLLMVQSNRENFTEFFVWVSSHQCWFICHQRSEWIFC